MPRAAKVKVPVTVLQQHGDSRLSAGPFFSGVRDLVESNKKVLVETTPYNQSTSVLYASDVLKSSKAGHPFQPTEFITVSGKDRRPRLVQSDDDFEISIVGMCVSSYDQFSFNEVLMFSLKANDEEEMIDDKNVPFIHYDPMRDGSGKGTPPNKFIPIPASKSLFLSYDGRCMPERERKKQVVCQFHILELDGAIEGKASPLSGLEELGHFASQFASSVPSFGTLEPVVSITAQIGKTVIKKHAQPDRVLSTNIKFLLRDSGGKQPKENESSKSQEQGMKIGGDYLRYGYYFFLSSAIDLKLYASTNASSQNLSLLLRRKDRISEGETEYFPLVGVSYLVIRVTKGLSTKQKCRSRKPIQISHAKRLEQLLAESTGAEDEETQQNLLKRFAQLAQDIGAPNMDSEGFAGVVPEANVSESAEEFYFPPGNQHISVVKEQAVPEDEPQTVHLPRGASSMEETGKENYFPPGNQHYK